MTLPAHVVHKLGLGLESIDGIEVFAEEPRENLEPVLDCELRCRENEEQMDTMTEVREELEKTIEAAEDIGAENFTSTHGQLFNVAISNTIAKLGLTLPDIQMASVEDFGDSPIAAFNASMEQSAELLIKAGQAIIKFLIEMKNRFIQWLKEIFSSASKQRVYTDKLLANGKDTKEQANKSIQVPRSFVDKSGTFQIAYVKNLDEALKVILTDIYTKFDQALAKGGDGEGSELAQILYGHGKEVARLGNMFTAGGLIIKPDANKWVKIDFIPDAGKMVEVNNPSLSDLQAMGSYLKSIGDTLISYNNRSKVRTTLIDKITNQIKKDVDSKHNPEEDGAAKKLKKQYQEASQAVNKAFNLERAIGRAGLGALIKGNSILKQGFKPSKEKS